MKYLIFVLLLFSFVYPQAPSNFNPISSTTVWAFKAGQRYTTATGVDYWADLVMDSSVTQSSTTRQPADNGTYFTGDADDFLQSNNNESGTGFDLGTADFTISGKFRKTTYSSTAVLCGKYAASDNYWYIGVYNDNDFAIYGRIAAGVGIYVYTNNADVLTNGTIYTFTFIVDRDDITGCHLYLNGNEIAVVSGGLVQARDIIVDDFFGIFARGGSTANYWNGDIYNLQFDNVLKDQTWAENFYDYNDGNIASDQTGYKHYKGNSGYSGY